MDDDDLQCPICGSPAKPLPRTGHAQGFDCPQHGSFKVSDTVLAVAGRHTASEFEMALEKAKKAAKPGEWPTIKTYDL